MKAYIKRLLSDTSGEPNLKLHGAAYSIAVLTVFGLLNLTTGQQVQDSIVAAFSTVVIGGFGASLFDNYNNKKKETIK